MSRLSKIPKPKWNRMFRGMQNGYKSILWILSMINVMNDQWSFIMLCLLIAHCCLWFGRFYTLAYGLYPIFQKIRRMLTINHYVVYLYKYICFCGSNHSQNETRWKMKANKVKCKVYKLIWTPIFFLLIFSYFWISRDRKCE